MRCVCKDTVPAASIMHEQVLDDRDSILIEEQQLYVGEQHESIWKHISRFIRSNQRMLLARR